MTAGLLLAGTLPAGTLLAGTPPAGRGRPGRGRGSCRVTQARPTWPDTQPDTGRRPAAWDGGSGRRCSRRWAGPG